LISGDTFRSYCEFQIDETITSFDPSLVQRGDALFVRMEYLRFFLDAIFPAIQHPFVLVTSNGAGVIDEMYLPYLEDPKIIEWFGRDVVIEHPKLCAIPLGVTWLQSIPYQVVKTYFSHLTTELFFSDKLFYCYLNIRNTHPSTRPRVLEIFANKIFCKFSRFVPFELYMAHVASSRFVISPRGWNIDCFRTWETLYAGSIPIVESSGLNALYEDLPVIIVEDWNQVTKEFLEVEFEKLRKKTFRLEKLHVQYWFDKIQRAKER